MYGNWEYLICHPVFGRWNLTFSLVSWSYQKQTDLALWFVPANEEFQAKGGWHCGVRPSTEPTLTVWKAVHADRGDSAAGYMLKDVRYKSSAEQAPCTVFGTLCVSDYSYYFVYGSFLPSPHCSIFSILALVQRQRFCKNFSCLAEHFSNNILFYFCWGSSPIYSLPCTACGHDLLSVTWGLTQITHSFLLYLLFTHVALVNFSKLQKRLGKPGMQN